MHRRNYKVEVLLTQMVSWDFSSVQVLAGCWGVPLWSMHANAKETKQYIMMSKLKKSDKE